MKSMVKGEKIKLEDLGLASNFEVGVTCQVAGSTADISCFGIDADGKLSDDRYFIFYNQPSSPEKAIEIKGASGGFDQVFSVNVQALPPTVVRLVFVATIDGSATFSDLSSGRFELLGPGGPAASFQFSGRDFAAEKAVMIGEVYLKTVWRLAAVGQGFNGGLSAVLKHFGGEETAAAPGAAPTPPAAEEPKVSLSKVRLDKQGEKHKVNLTKDGAPQIFHINLQWDQPSGGGGGSLLGRLLGGRSGGGADLDLGCMWRDRQGNQGVIQPLGGNFGSPTGIPFISLDKDDRSGAAADGENMHLMRPETISLVVIFAMIYEGTANFSNVNARLTIFDGKGGEILIPLNAPDPRRTFCAVASVTGDGGALNVQKEERYFTGHKECDQFYGFGFNWVRGSK
ncbi:tellurium resistance protein TerA [Deltaproteobacteria bacterium Smac51]|nr:tellurium resistance protein TerA [Deltaproteobacteria bacterium Smac51]